MRRACATEILKGPHVWSCQNDFSWILTQNNNEYIRRSFSIGNFERYVNSKSDYLELLLSVYPLSRSYLQGHLRDKRTLFGWFL